MKSIDTWKFKIICTAHYYFKIFYSYISALTSNQAGIY